MLHLGVSTLDALLNTLHRLFGRLFDRALNTSLWYVLCLERFRARCQLNTVHNSSMTQRKQRCVWSISGQYYVPAPCPHHHPVLWTSWSCILLFLMRRSSLLTREWHYERLSLQLIGGGIKIAVSLRVLIIQGWEQCLWFRLEPEPTFLRYQTNSYCNLHFMTRNLHLFCTIITVHRSTQWGQSIVITKYYHFTPHQLLTSAHFSFQ